MSDYSAGFYPLNNNEWGRLKNTNSHLMACYVFFKDGSKKECAAINYFTEIRYIIVSDDRLIVGDKREGAYYERPNLKEPVLGFDEVWSMPLTDIIIQLSSFCMPLDKDGIPLDPLLKDKTSRSYGTILSAIIKTKFSYDADKDTYRFNEQP